MKYYNRKTNVRRNMKKLYKEHWKVLQEDFLPESKIDLQRVQAWTSSFNKIPQISFLNNRVFNDCEGISVYINNDFSRADVCDELANSEIAQLLTLRSILPVVDFPVQTAINIDNRIKSYYSIVNSNSAKFKRFLNEALVPEVSKKVMRQSHGLKCGFAYDEITANGINDMSLRDSLNNLNKLIMYNRKNFIKVDGIQLYTDKHSSHVNTIKFQYPLMCTLRSSEAIEKFSIMGYYLSTLKLLNNLRILVVSRVGDIINLSVISLYDLSSVLGDGNACSFLNKLFNNECKEDLIDFYKIRNCIAQQMHELYSNSCIRTMPVVVLSTRPVEGIVSYSHRFTNVLNANDDIKNFIHLFKPNNIENEVSLEILFYDVIVANVPISSNNMFDVNGKFVGVDYNNDCVHVARILLEELRLILSKNDNNERRHIAILDALRIQNDNGIAADNRVILEALLNNKDVGKYSERDLKDIYMMAVGLSREQFNAFISMFIDATQVATAYRIYMNEEDINWRSDESCILGLYLSYFVNPVPLKGISSNLTESLNACINYGLVKIDNIKNGTEVEYNPVEVPSILYIASNNGSLNISLEQVFTLYASKLLDQLMHLRHTDFFYVNIKPESFKFKLRQWLEQYIPGFLKQPIVNPFESVSRPFIRAPYHHNTRLPDRQVLLPDVTTYRDIDN